MRAVVESFGSERLLDEMNERLLKGKGTVTSAKDYSSGLDEIFPYAERTGSTATRSGATTTSG